MDAYDLNGLCLSYDGVFKLAWKMFLPGNSKMLNIPNSKAIPIFEKIPFINFEKGKGEF